MGTFWKCVLVKFMYSKALRCTFFWELKSSCSSKSCIIRSVVCNTVFKNKKNPCCWRSVLYSTCSCISSTYSVQKRAKTYLLTKKCASPGLLYQKTCKNMQKTYKNVQKHAKTCKNLHLKCFWTLFKNMHCQSPCILRPCISRPYCKTNSC